MVGSSSGELSNSSSSHSTSSSSRVEHGTASKHESDDSQLPADVEGADKHVLALSHCDLRANAQGTLPCALVPAPPPSSRPLISPRKRAAVELDEGNSRVAPKVGEIGHVYSGEGRSHGSEEGVETLSNPEQCQGHEKLGSLSTLVEGIDSSNIKQEPDATAIEHVVQIQREDHTQSLRLIVSVNCTGDAEASMTLSHFPWTKQRIRAAGGLGRGNVSREEGKGVLRAVSRSTSSSTASLATLGGGSPSSSDRKRKRNFTQDESGNVYDAEMGISSAAGENSTGENSTGGSPLLSLSTRMVGIVDLDGTGHTTERDLKEADCAVDEAAADFKIRRLVGSDPSAGVDRIPSTGSQEAHELHERDTAVGAMETANVLESEDGMDFVNKGGDSEQGP